MKRKNMAAMVTSIVLVGAVAVGGTLALLSQGSNTVKNTFTVGADYPASALKVREHEANQNATGAWVGKGDNLWMLNPDNENAATEGDYVGIKYENLVGGTTVDKDPQFVLASGSPKSWVTCYIDGLTELENYVTVTGVTGADAGVNGDWYRYELSGRSFAEKYVKVERAADIKDDHWYIFSEKVTGQGIVPASPSVTDPIFTKLTVNTNVAKNNAAAEGDADESTLPLKDCEIEVKGVAVQVVNDSLTNEKAWDAVMTAAQDAVKQG